MSIEIVTTSPAHREGWNALYAEYAKFYKVEQSQEMRDRVWGWLQDAAAPVEGLVAVDGGGRVVGLAHFREFYRPLAAARAGYLDDLFVDPATRGTGTAQKLIETIAEAGRQRQWTVLRWITRDNNYRARSAYDRIATQTNWVTYDIPL